MLESLKLLVSDESGQGLPEYALLTAAVVVMVVALGWLWTSGDVFEGIDEWISEKNAMRTPPGSVDMPGGGGAPAPYPESPE